MPVLNDSEYQPSFLFKSGHFNSIYSHISRRTESCTFDRKRIQTPDDDFLDIDFVHTGSSQLIVLFHGLEGSSDSSYIKEFANGFSQLDYDIAAMNYRGCSGEMNRQLRLYHSGSTDDIHTVLTEITKGYDRVYLIGFSLGGNMCLKYLGEQVYDIPSVVQGCVSISPPTDLESCSLQIMKRQNWIYEKRFLTSLADKVKQKEKQFPGKVPLSKLSEAKRIYSFDDMFVAPMHGFKNAKDYYQQCSSKQFLSNITHPSLILTSIDDPFLSKAAIPVKEAQQNSLIYLYPCKFGGHVGFHQKGNRKSWMLEKSIEFIQQL